MVAHNDGRRKGMARFIEASRDPNEMVQVDSYEKVTIEETVTIEVWIKTQAMLRRKDFEAIPYAEVVDSEVPPELDITRAKTKRTADVVLENERRS